MTSRQVALVLAAHFFIAIPAARAQWVDAPAISVEGRGHGNACVKDAAARSSSVAWHRVLTTLTLPASDAVVACAMANGERLIEVTPRKSDVRYTSSERCEVPFTVRFRRIAAAEAIRSTCLSADADIPIGIVVRAERVDGPDSTPTVNESDADAARAALEAWVAKASLRPVSLPEYQDAFIRLKTSLGEYAVGNGGAPHETVFGSAREARTVLSRWLGGVLADARAETPALQRWRSCGGLLAIATVRLTNRVDEKGFADVRGAMQVTYFALSRDLTVIDSDFIELPQPVFDSNGGNAEAARQVLNRLVGTVGARATQKLTTFTHSEGCTAP